MIIEFRNTVLRPMVEQDQKKVLCWRKKKEISQFMLTDIESNTHEDQMLWFNKINKDKSCKYWIILKGNLPVGVVNLNEIDTKRKFTNWAFYIGETLPNLQGVGAKVEFMIINYVFFKMKFEKLLCQVLSNNLKVVTLHKKFGFEQNEIQKSKCKKNGKLLNLYQLSMTKETAIKRTYDKLSISYKEKY